VYLVAGVQKEHALWFERVKAKLHRIISECQKRLTVIAASVLAQLKSKFRNFGACPGALQFQ
jgi:hypothetical protein